MNAVIVNVSKAADWVLTPTRSKWGYHVCTKEQFLYLKEAHKLLLRAYRDVKRWAAWERKTVHRVGPEPVIPSGFVTLGYHVSGQKVWYGYGFRLAGTEKSGKTNLYQHMLNIYRVARRPHALAEELPRLEMPTDLKEILAALSAFYSGTGPEPVQENRS